MVLSGATVPPSVGRGLFGPSFSVPQPGVRVVPAQTSPVPGHYSGPMAVVSAGGHPWIWGVVALAAIVAAALIAVLATRRGPDAAAGPRPPGR